MASFRSVFLYCTCLVFFAACGPERSLNRTSERPYDPWVIRSVLDEQPRMVTLALHDHGDAQVWFRNIKIRKL